jgi:hypothetical protein
VLRNALESAVREEIIPRNVAKLVQVPAPRYKVNRGLTTQQAKATLQAAAAERTGPSGQGQGTVAETHAGSCRSGPRSGSGIRPGAGR